MIEVEKKFELTEDNRKKLVDGAEFVKSKTMTDSYFDDANYSLGRKDFWLRKRNGKFELKTPLNFLPQEERVACQYREIEDEKEIIECLKFNSDNPLENSLEENGYLPFMTAVTKREEYTKEGFVIDIDSTDFGYEIAEIELMVENESDILDTLDF